MTRANWNPATVTVQQWIHAWASLYAAMYELAALAPDENPAGWLAAKLRIWVERAAADPSPGPWSPRLRQAIAEGIDYDAIAQHWLSGLGDVVS